MPFRKEKRGKKEALQDLGWAQFFTTHILFDTGQIIDILVEYNSL